MIERDSANTEKTTEIDIYNGTGGHINFFKDAEDGVMIGISKGRGNEQKCLNKDSTE